MYRGADKSLVRPTSRCILFDGENISCDASLVYIYTGILISPSGISDPCGTVAGMVTLKGSMSTEGETLQVSVLPYRCSKFVDF